MFGLPFLLALAQAGLQGGALLVELLRDQLVPLARRQTEEQVDEAVAQGKIHTGFMQVAQDHQPRVVVRQQRDVARKPSIAPPCEISRWPW